MDKQMELKLVKKCGLDYGSIAKIREAVDLR
jgi:hypothetical protein